MRVLVACEESQAVCIAFRGRGHEAFSCDLQECSGNHPEWHIRGDALLVAMADPWDLMIAFPPCTYLSSVQTFLCRKDPARVLKRIEAAKFFMDLANCEINKIAIENPSGVMREIWREQDQVVHPYFFGDTEMKRTCLWLKNLPKLQHIEHSGLFDSSTYGDLVHYDKKWVQKNSGRLRYQRKASRPFTSSKERSKISLFLAKAMAEQWG